MNDDASARSIASLKALMFRDALRGRELVNLLAIQSFSSATIRKGDFHRLPPRGVGNPQRIPGGFRLVRRCAVPGASMAKGLAGH